MLKRVWIVLKDRFHVYVWCSHPASERFVEGYVPMLGDHPDETDWCTQCHRPVKP